MLNNIEIEIFNFFFFACLQFLFSIVYTNKLWK